MVTPGGPGLDVHPTGLPSTYDSLVDAVREADLMTSALITNMNGTTTYTAGGVLVDLTKASGPLLAGFETQKGGNILDGALSVASTIKSNNQKVWQNLR